MYIRSRIIKALEKRLDAGRLRHSLAVERAAVRLAAAHGADWYRAGIAGLAHDICRCDHPEWQLEYIRRSGICLNREWIACPDIWHGPCACAVLKRELGIRDREILRAVRYHTTARAGMSRLEKVLFLADGVSEDRVYDGVAKLREAAFRDLDEGVRQWIKIKILYAVEKRLPLVRESLEAYNESLAV